MGRLLGPALRDCRSTRTATDGRPLRAALGRGLHVGTSGWSIRPGAAASTRPTQSPRLPSPYARALRHRRAEHDGLPPAGRGSVRALGGAGAGRLHVCTEAPRLPARPDRRLLRAHAAARRPARPGAGQVQSARDDGWLMFLLGSCRPGDPARVRLPARLVGRRRAREVAVVNDLERDAAFRFSACASRPTPTRSSPAGASGSAAAVPVYVYFRHEDEPTAPAYAERLRELVSSPSTE